MACLTNTQSNRALNMQNSQVSSVSGTESYEKRGGGAEGCMVGNQGECQSINNEHWPNRRKIKTTAGGGGYHSISASAQSITCNHTMLPPPPPPPPPAYRNLNMNALKRKESQRRLWIRKYRCWLCIFVGARIQFTAIRSCDDWMPSVAPW